jgi:hypothetical protein
MQQRAVVRFRRLKGPNLPLIHPELESVCREDALALPTVCKWNAPFRDGRTKLSDELGFGRPSKSDLAEPIMSMSKERPFSYCKLVARYSRVAKAICPRIVYEDLGLQKFDIRSVPHILDSAPKRNRVTLSRELLDILRREQKCCFENVITEHESWFFTHYPIESAWVGSQD